MKSVSGRRLVKALEKKGWSLLRIQGSHHIYGKTVASIPHHPGYLPRPFAGQRAPCFRYDVLDLRTQD